MKEILLSIKGMSCQSCKATVEKKLSSTDGVKEVHVSLIQSMAHIVYNEKKTNPEALVKLIQSLGYQAQLPQDDEGEHSHHHTLKSKDEHSEHRNMDLTDMDLMSLSMNMDVMGMDHSQPQSQMPHFKGILVLMNLAFSILVMIFSMGKSTLTNELIQLILTTWILISNWHMIITGWRGLKNFHPNMYSLVFLGAFSGYFYSLGLMIYSQIYHSGLHQMFFFDATAAVLSFLAIGDFLQARGTERVRKNLGEIKNDLPKNVSLFVEGRETIVPLSQIKKGDIILVKPGGMIPLDGILVEGEVEITETLLTGELSPIKKYQGDHLTSGTYALNSSILLEVNRPLKESFFYKVKSSLVDIEQSKTPILALVDKISYYFVPVVILLSLGSFLFWGFSGESWAFALKIGISVLVVACPCALGLATPLAVMVFFGTAFKEGFLLKNSRILSAIKTIDTCLLDKTGTLTSGHLSVVEWGLAEGSHIDTFVFALESQSNHPYARAIVRYLKENKVPKQVLVQNFKLYDGVGIEAYIDGRVVRIGNSSFIDINEVQNQTQKLATTLGKTILWMSIDGENQGYILLEDSLRMGAQAWVDFAKQEKYDLQVLSGDNSASVEFVAKKLGIDKFQGNLKPFDKLEIVKNLQSQGHKILMIGDGLNDSLVLAQSDLSLTLGNAADLAAQSGDIIAINEDLSQFAVLMKFTKKTNKVITENLFWAFFYNIVTLPWAMGIFYFFGGGLLNPMMGALSMALSSLIVVVNSLRLLRFRG